MPSPLFRAASRAIKAAARSEFRTSGIGRMLTELERQTVRRGQAQRYLKDIAQQIRRQPPTGWIERVGGRVERYARQTREEQIMERVYQALGPLGDIARSMLRPKGKRLTTLDRELQGAQNLLQAFGFEVIPPPPLRGGEPAQARAAQQYLETLGFQVSRKALPGWAAARTTQSAPRRVEDEPAPERARTAQTRRTVDLDVGTGRPKRVRLDDPLLTGAMVPVISSNVHSIGFDVNPQNAAIGTLKVRFWMKRGQGRVAGAFYEYYHVPTDVFLRFRKAASKGKFVWDKLRIRGTVSGHRFDYKLAGIAYGYVPRKATLTPAGEYFTKRTFLGQNTRTGETRLFQSRESALVRPGATRPNRGTPPNRGRPDRGRR
jgi:hypothetical protein